MSAASFPVFRVTFYDPGEDGPAWPHVSNMPLRAGTQQAAEIEVFKMLLGATRDLHASDGYETGDRIRASIWKGEREVSSLSYPIKVTS